NRFNDTLISALGIDRVLKARLRELELQREPLRARLDELARGELSPEEIAKVFGEIESLWVSELQLLESLAQRGIGRGDFEMAVGRYRQHVAQMELRLARLGIEGPRSGEQTFRPLIPGVVAFKPEGRAYLER